MLDKFFYKGNDGNTITFGEGGLYANYNDLRDYSWAYSLVNDKITGFYREAKEKSLPVVFIGKTMEECRTNRNRVFTTFERDVISGKKGKLFIGDYYLNCFVFGAENEDYLMHEHFMKTTFKIVTDDPTWHKDTSISILPSREIPDIGLEYPYDFPYDYTATGLTAKNINNPSDFPSEFTMIIYGACENPSIEIGGHTYRVNASITDGERIEIDSSEGTINKVSADRTVLNFFRYRYKPESIFEKIPSGLSSLSWSGDFGFDITLHEMRSEPIWTFNKASADIIDDVESDDGYYLLLDSNGDYILDSDGNRIEVRA